MREIVASLCLIPMGFERQTKQMIERLMMQVEHVLVANKITVVTKEVVETAQQNLIIGPG